MSLSKKEKKRIKKLQENVYDEKGNHKPDADFEELQELAKLEAKQASRATNAESQDDPEKTETGDDGNADETDGESQTGDDESESAEKNSKPETPPKPRQNAKGVFKPACNPKKKCPKIAKYHVDRGYLYLGKDENNEHIFFNPSLNRYYRIRNNNEPEFLGCIGTGLNKEYAESLK